MNRLGSFRRCGATIPLASMTTLKRHSWSSHKLIFKLKSHCKKAELSFFFKFWTLQLNNYFLLLQESEQPNVERLKMQLCSQDLHHVTKLTFTLNQSRTHTLTGSESDQIWRFSFSYDSLSIVEGKDQPSSVRSSLDLFPVPFVFASCKWQLCLAPPLPSAPTHRALFSTPVNDKTMLPCYLTAAADGDYGPVEAWCLSRASRGLPAPWSHASAPGVNSGVKHPERLEKISSSMRSLGARELLLFFCPFSVVSFVPGASQVWIQKGLCGGNGNQQGSWSWRRGKFIAEGRAQILHIPLICTQVADYPFQ